MQLVQSNKAISEPSEVVSRYLEAIYYMWFEKEPLRSARLADWLGVSRPTVAGHSEAWPREARLSSLAPGQGATITRVSEVAEREAPLLLAYLSQRDLTPGREVSVEETDVVGKTLRVRVAERDVTLSHETASKIWAVPRGKS